jgi:signal transduction histidine kinase
MSASPQTQATVLVVDDNPATRYSTGRVLRKAGFAVIEAGTGGEALQQSLQGPDLIILDVNLPDIDGFEVCRRLRAQPITARTPVVHLSATFVDTANQVQGFESGADGYITHPVEPPVLVATVNAFLRTRRAEDAARIAEADRERLLASERAARAEAERANNIKDEFLAALSHELRTPLNAIVGWAAVLKRRIPRGDPDIVRSVEAIERNARLQTQLIADLLDVSRITSGKLVLNREWFDPAETIDISVGGLQDTARARGVRIQTELHAVPNVHWDPARFQQVIWNLLDNAVKFSDPGGTVVVRLTATDDAVEFSVADQGRGISPEFLPHIFERFRQENSGSSRPHGGLGLGLAIVKSLVDVHGAAITAESAGPRQGTIFTVHMPLASDAQTLPAAPNEIPSYNLKALRVLIVEDDEDARDLISGVFQEAHALVCATSNVVAALEQVERFAPQLLVSDLGIPGQDGYDLIRQVRAAGHPPSLLPAIALTAFGRDEDRAKALQAGYQYHVMKPVEPHQILRIAAQLTGARQPS